MQSEFEMSHSLKIVQLASHPGQCAVAKPHYRPERFLESDELPTLPTASESRYIATLNRIYGVDFP
jgi:hypothetical protein